MLPRDYSVRDVSKGIKEPSLFLSAGLDILDRDIYSAIRRYIFNIKYDSGVEVMAEDWDTLVILDAARYDEFSRRNTIAGQLEPRLSLGGYSEEFIQKNFAGRQLHNTVYVSGNPYAMDLAQDVFHDIIMVRDRPLVLEEIDTRDTEFSAVYPDDILDQAIKANEKYPNKRLIVHFMQPHTPFIGDKGKQLYRQIYIQRNKNKNNGAQQDPGTELVRPYAAAKSPEFSINDSDIRDAYRDNLDIAIKYAQIITDKIPGKTVVTADHGELLGERYLKYRYGHPHHIRVPELYMIPWLVIDSKNRRSVKSEQPVDKDRPDEKAINKQLSALGYNNAG